MILAGNFWLGLDVSPMRTFFISLAYSCRGFERQLQAMHIDLKHRYHRAFLVAGSFLLALVFVLSACGTNTATGSQSGSTPTPTTTLQASTNGCPDSAAVTNTPAPASVVLTNKSTGDTVSVNKGKVVEVRLPQGMSWSGPAKLASNVLALQGPAGYASSADKTCIWRFMAVGTGTTQLSFTGRPICKKNQMCPMYIVAMPFTVEVK